MAAALGMCLAKTQLIVALTIGSLPLTFSKKSGSGWLRAVYCSGLSPKKETMSFHLTILGDVFTLLLYFQALHLYSSGKMKEG